MPTVAELQIVIEAQDRASAQLRTLGADVQRIEQQVESAGGAFGRLGGVIGGLGKVGLAAGGIGAIVDSFRGAFDAVGSVVGQASDLNEQLSRSEQVFGDAAQSVQAFAKTTADGLGISRREALQAAGDFGQLLRTSGLTADASADMSTNLVRLGADLASFNNIDPREALEKLRSGLVGEAEPLRTLGVMLSEEAVKLKAVELGLVGSNKELTEAQKVQARYALILEQSRQAQGDFARTSDGLANSTRRIRAAWEDITTVLGSAFLPVVARVATALADLLKAVRPVAEELTKQLGPALAALFSGDLRTALEQTAPLIAGLADRLGPALQTWSRAFLDWAAQVAPQLLAALGDVAGAIGAWIRAQAPPFLQALVTEWIPAFLDWLGQVTPPLLERLAALAGDVFAWIRQQAPPLLQTMLAEWAPAMVDWVIAVTPRVLEALAKMLAAIGAWVGGEGGKQMLGFGQELGEAFIKGMATGLERIGPLLGETLDRLTKDNPVVAAILRAAVSGGPIPGGAVLIPLIPALQQGTPSLSPAAVAAAGGGGTTVVVENGAVQVSGVADPAESDRLREFLKRALEAYSQGLAASAASTDPGAAARLQGAGR